MQVYLPDDLYKLVKARRLPASELLQDAVRAEVRRRELLAETDKYPAELVVEVGMPTARQRARAKGIAQRIAARARRAGCPMPGLVLDSHADHVALVKI